MDEEDAVSYWLYPTDRSLQPDLTLATCFKLVEEYVSNYVWHCQQFNLATVREGSSWHFAGRLRYGENVDDEWFVVSLLAHLTKCLPGLVGRVTDADGEILLIEAADSLPRWAADPAAAEGRVYISGGRVHLLPRAQHPGQLTPLPWRPPAPRQAALTVSLLPELTLAPQPLQRCIDDRLAGFPADAGRNHHRAPVLLPQLTAAVLHHCPAALGRLVGALHDKDAVDTRRCRQMERVRPDKMSAYTVKFSRCLYAMLSQQGSSQPARSSGWRLPPSNSDPGHRPAQLGYLLSFGLEILLARSEGCPSDSEASRPAVGFDRFVSKLDEIDYFRGELRGSKKYNELLESARVFFMEDQSAEEDGEPAVNENTDVVRLYRDYVASRLDVSELLAPPAPAQDESWLHVDPESLDRMLAARFGVRSTQNDDLIPRDLDNFLKKASDMSGVELDPGSSAAAEVSFNPDELISSLKKIVGENSDEDSSSSLPSDDDDEEPFDEASQAEDPVIVDYMKKLDGEVGGLQGRDDLPDLDKPLEVDSSVLKNLVASFEAQCGLAGPTSTLLQPLGVNLRATTEK